MSPLVSKMPATDKLRIALVAPLFYTIPPTKYGGTERVVAYLIQELHKMGHHVTLYGTAGCKTAADLVECIPVTLASAGVRGVIPKMEPPYTLQLKRVLADLTQFDVVHIHHGVLPFQPALFPRPGPFLFTDHTELHVEKKGETLQKLYDSARAGITSVSESQRGILTGEKYFLGTVYNGIPQYLLAPMLTTTPTYLAFLGRLSPEKGAPEAVDIAVRAGINLRVAAKIEDIHVQFYKEKVKPVFEMHDVDFIGEIDDEGKSEFFSGAIALIFPIQWSEPFGLVMIEAMACGVPVIAYNKGAVPEVIEDGVTGFIVDTAEEAAAMVKEVAKLDRNKIRLEFEKRFTSRVMAERYVDIYHRIREGKAWNEDGTANIPAVGNDKNALTNIDHDTAEHVCPGHNHCVHAPAAKLEESAAAAAAGEGGLVEVGQLLAEDTDFDQGCIKSSDTNAVFPDTV